MLAFETLFWFFFVAVAAFIVVTWVLRLMRYNRQSTESEETQNQTVIREKEIIREIVKVRCPYCNNLYDEKLDKCPYCGGKHP